MSDGNTKPVSKPEESQRVRSFQEALVAPSLSFLSGVMVELRRWQHREPEDGSGQPQGSQGHLCAAVGAPHAQEQEVKQANGATFASLDLSRAPGEADGILLST